MPRLNTNAELWSHLSTFYYYHDSTAGVSTTIDAAVAVGGSTASVAASATGAVGAYCRLGPSGGADLVRIESGSSIAFTALSQFAYAHSSGEALVQQIETDLGDLSDAGVNLEVQTDRTRIDAATQRHRYAWHVAHSDYVCTVQFENLSMENWLVSMGIDESNVHGAGSSGDPYVADWTPDDIDTLDPLHFAAEGARKDGTTVRVEFWDCDIDPGKTMALARGQDAPLQLAFSARHIRILEPFP